VLLEQSGLVNQAYHHKLKYLICFQVDGHIFVAYNPGSQDNAIGEMNAKVNDGRYHVVRFTRSAANSTLQVDDNQIQTKFPDGEFKRPIKKLYQLFKALLVVLCLLVI